MRCDKGADIPPSKFKMGLAMDSLISRSAIKKLPQYQKRGLEGCLEAVSCQQRSGGGWFEAVTDQKCNDTRP